MHIINGNRNGISIFTYSNDVFIVDKKYTVNELIYETDYCMVGEGFEYELLKGNEIISQLTPIREIMIKKYINLLGIRGGTWNWDLSLKFLNELKVYNTLKDQTKMVPLIDIMLIVACDNSDEQQKHRKIFNHKFNDMYLVFEKYGKDLVYIFNEEEALLDDDMDVKVWLLRELLSAVSCLHSQKLIHRDLCPSNVCVSFDEKTLKLKSFGLSCGFSSRVFLCNKDDEEEETAAAADEITPIYTAPEIILGFKMSPSVDVWGVGCIFAEILNGGYPLFFLPPTTEPTNVNKLVTIFTTLETKGSLDKLSSNPSAIDLLRKMLALNPAERISLKEAQQHPYFFSSGGVGTELVVCRGEEEEEDIGGVVEVTVPEVVEPDSHSLRKLIWTEMQTFEVNKALEMNKKKKKM